jgi:hypothetical protein
MRILAVYTIMSTEAEIERRKSLVDRVGGAT